MEKIKEQNKNLIALRNNYFAMIIVISSGIAGLLMLEMNPLKFFTLFAIGLYFDLVFVLKFENTLEMIEKNIKEINK